MKNDNGKQIYTPQQDDPFDGLIQAVMRCASGRNERERLGSMQVVQRMIAGLRAAMLQMNQDKNRLLSILETVSGGQLAQAQIAPRKDLKSIRFEDANGKPVICADPASGLLLVASDNQRPVTAVLTLTDGSQERTTLEDLDPKPEETGEAEAVEA